MCSQNLPEVVFFTLHNEGNNTSEVVKISDRSYYLLLGDMNTL